MRNLIVNEFQGKLFPVNPNADSVWGVKAYPSVLDVPDPVDLAIVAIPADAALEAVEQCARKGVRGLVVITAGFREIGGVGEAREARPREPEELRPDRAPGHQEEARDRREGGPDGGGRSRHGEPHGLPRR